MIENKKIVILGMARSGIAVAKLLANYHNEILLTDIKEEQEKTMEELKKLGISIIITKEQEKLVDSTIDIIIKNPAILSTHKALLKAKELNIPIINEVEASFPLLPDDVKIIGITGSNGKTTTTTLIYEMLKRANLPVYLGGNIGIPLASIVKEIKNHSILVLEISDHQLCDVEKFKTDISVLTNLSEVHLDFHGSYQKYKEMKKRIFNHHTSDSIAILNKENKDSLLLTEDIPSKKLYFSSKAKADVYLQNEKIYYQEEPILDTKEIKLKGTHNYENIMAALLVVKQFNVSNEIIASFLKEFGGVEHRIEFVRELKKRTFYNDSKATNNESTSIALKAFPTPILLIMGGLDRNIPFDSLQKDLKNVKYIFCYGETKEKIKEFADKNKKKAILCENLVEATKKAYEKSEEGDTILLSPACASWDQYENFEIRGQEFKETVWKLN